MAERFGDLVRKYRKDAKLSQSDLIAKLEEQGYRVGSKGTISKWENGVNIPNDEVIEYLEDIFKTRNGTLFNAAGKAEMAAYRAAQEPSDDSGLGHDVMVFEESDAILSEDDVKRLTSNLEDNLCYNFSQQQKVLQYLSFFSFVDGSAKEATQYLNADVQSGLKEVLRSLQDFLAFSSEYFDADNRSPDYRILLYPYHSDVLTKDEYEKLRPSGSFAPYGATVDRYHAMLHPRIEKYVRELKRHAGDIDSCFKSYRSAVRNILHV